MKSYLPKIRSSLQHQRGFALIVTLSLMVLLAVVAVGLLTLATISLRSSDRNKAAETARANARLALMLAIGELQKSAGPDQRITATGSIVQDPSASDNVAMPAITGVWKSWKVDPNSPPAASDYQKNTGKKSKFLTWLVSHPTPATTQDQNFPTTSLPQNQRVTLMPAFTLASVTTPELVGGLVPLSDSVSGKVGGGCAWAVLDEGTKARIDTGYRNPSGTKLGDQSLAFGSGLRADVSKISGLEAFTKDKADLTLADSVLSKGISLATSKLLYQAIGGDPNAKIKELGNDITVDSVGLFTDAANGGLKQDLNSILNTNSLPSDLASQGIYATQLKFNTPSDAATGKIDPQWSPLQKFSMLYQSNVSASPAPYLDVLAPTGWATAEASQPPPAGVNPVILPTISKVQIFYSLVACPLKQGNNAASNPWVFGNDAGFKIPWDNGARYILYLVYTPVITLHNPYNIALNIPKLAIEFKNVPMSIQISRNGGGFSLAEPGAVQSLYQGAGSLKWMKSFKFTLKNAAGSNTALRLQPGELVAFSPDIPTNASFQSERSGARSARTFVDTQDGNAISGGVIVSALDTSLQSARRGFRGIAAGYALDWVNFGSGAYPDPPYNMNNSASLFSGPNDTFRVKFRPASDGRVASDKQGIFSVVMSDGAVSTLTALNFDFSGPKSGNLMTGLEEALNLTSAGTVYPPSDEPALSIGQIAVPTSTTPIKDFPSNAYALVTATAKTTLANQDGTNYEGRYAGKPWSFTAPVGSFLRQRIDKAATVVHQSQYPYELDVVALSPATGHGGDDYVSSDPLGRGYGITGQTATFGKQFATAYEVPLAPLQAMPQLNSASLASGNSLARFLYPIGNSWAHPMLATSQITAPAPLADLAAQYDHSFLLNLSLYDSFYFSGIAPRGGTFIDSVTTREIAEDFIYGSGEKMTDARLIPWIPATGSAASAIDALAAPDTARKQAAAYQLMKGAFNVNSTSKQAWKAMLASIHAEKARMNAIDRTVITGNSKVSDLTAAPADKVRFSRFRVPNSEAPGVGTEDAAQSFFLGPRDITDAQLGKLAEEIVVQVKTRGPFLSMAEFVNRQLGPASDLTLKGALQAAIDRSNINSDDNALPTLTKTGYEIGSSQIGTYKLVNPDAATGRSDQGAPGNISQADLLTALGNAATVRSDTFRIRSYGEARDANGNVIARAWCEAVVQRRPDFVSSIDNPTLSPGDSSMQPVNKTFGRAFVITSFRWLQASEIKS
ncbi:MAG: hypothetical protein ABI600_16960 [Luteolibacter sp.]